jgi:hypothetical protein
MATEDAMPPALMRVNRLLQALAEDKVQNTWLRKSYRMAFCSIGVGLRWRCASIALCSLPHYPLEIIRSSMSV